MPNVVYFDLETQRTANDVGGWDKKREMGMSLGVTFSTATGEYAIYTENRVNDLITELLRADVVVGFNVVNFDLEVLTAYTILDLPGQVVSFDLLVDLEKKLGHRLALDSLAKATLGVGKIADGMDAIRWWREGRLLPIAEYCCFDVKVTRMLHEYGCRNAEVFFDDRFNRRRRCEVSWSVPVAGRHEPCTSDASNGAGGKSTRRAAVDAA